MATQQFGGANAGCTNVTRGTLAHGAYPPVSALSDRSSYWSLCSLPAFRKPSLQFCKYEPPKRKQAVLSLKRYGWRLSRKIWRFLLCCFLYDTWAETKPTGSASCITTQGFPAVLPQIPREHELFSPATWHPQVLLPPFCTGSPCIPPTLATTSPHVSPLPALAIRKWCLGVCGLLQRIHSSPGGKQVHCWSAWTDSAAAHADLRKCPRDHRLSKRWCYTMYTQAEIGSLALGWGHRTQ